jgi:hypothetical protein
MVGGQIRRFIQFDISRFVMTMAANLIDRNVGLTSQEIAKLKSEFTDAQFSPEVRTYIDKVERGIISRRRRGRPRRPELGAKLRVMILADYQEALIKEQKNDRLLSKHDRKKHRHMVETPSHRALDRVRSIHPAIKSLQRNDEVLRNRFSNWRKNQPIRRLVNQVLLERGIVCQHQQRHVDKV